MDQDRIFKDSEGDSWFKRNKKSLNHESLKKDVVLNLVRLYDDIRPRRILEIGCSNGHRLRYLKDRYDCSCTGIDCSRMAIEDGRKRHKGLRLFCGGADKLNFKNSTFDPVVINFVLHWIGRKVLPKVISEMDRVLKDKGLLVVGDFYPSRPMKVRYHHLPNQKVFTFKDDYSRMFEKLGHYQNIGRISGECCTRRICVGVAYDERFKIDLLKKDIGLKGL